MVGLQTEDNDRHVFLVSSAPILSDGGELRGALVSFEDVTAMERQRAELQQTLDALSKSRDEIRRQNEELEVLATLDPLTGCLNRRSFFVQFEEAWHSAKRQRRSLSCVMVDVDNFKSINDQCGHRTGDQVLQSMASILQVDREAGDLVCRYGGEEFCLVLPDHDMGKAERVAEQIRCAIRDLDVEGLRITASLGISDIDQDASELQELLDQADKCLYLAKRAGRNRVVRWDAMPDDLVDDTVLHRSAPHDDRPRIPFHAVTALISALSYRDAETAEHSRRVADWCVAVAEGLMPTGEVYMLEIAALLHDIGKIGVPDSILLKPGPLTDEEWRIMRAQARIGSEILRSTFGHEQLAELVRLHSAHYRGQADRPDLPTGQQIPMGARILCIADAYDAIVTNKTYRAGKSSEAALAELRRWAGRQFDPELVKRFVEVVRSRGDWQPSSHMSTTKEAALKIGIQIERLAQALDNRDLFGLKTLAGRLHATAAKSGLEPIAQQAQYLEQIADQKGDLIELVQITRELLDLCRATQTVFVGERGSVSNSFLAPGEASPQRR
jgi:diguanylate cyclase (GGDEF)-like protein